MSSKLASDATFHEKFEWKLAEYEQQNKASQKKPWTATKILEVMTNVRNARKSISSNQSKSSTDFYWTSKYDIVTIGKEEHLVFKRKTPDKSTVRIVPRHDYFKILKQIHENCGHGGRDKMIETIKSTLYIPNKAIQIFVALCPTCKVERQQPETDAVASVRGQVSLIDFESHPDCGYKWLLHYQDKTTKFTSLRPLRKKKNENEIATKLVRIFTAFGPPDILEYSIGPIFAKKVTRELTAMWPQLKIVHENLRYSWKQDENNELIIHGMLNVWMKNNNSTNWSVGCYHVQYEYNTSCNRVTGKSPFKALFGHDPNSSKNQTSEPEVNCKDLTDTPLSTEFVSERQIEIMDCDDDAPSELGPCYSMNSVNSQNIITVQDEDCSITVKIEDIEPSSTCVVCNEVCSDTHICSSCEWTVHENCGKYEQQLGMGSTLLCFLCKNQSDSSEDIQMLERVKSEDIETVSTCLVCHKTYTDTCSCENTTSIGSVSELDSFQKPNKRTNVEEIVKNDELPLKINETVMISVPKVGCGPLDTHKVKGKIVDSRNGLYQVGTKAGIIKHWFERHELQFLCSNYNGAVPNVLISLRRAVSMDS